MDDNPDVLLQLLQILTSLGTALGELILLIGRLAIQNWLFILWVAWWLWGVNWNKTWQVLARGAWMPVVLLVLMIALVWSKLAPDTCDCLGFITVPNFWWQLGELSLLVAIALFCGWLQGVFGWAPAEIDLEPPAAPAHGHTHH